VEPLQVIANNGVLKLHVNGKKSPASACAIHAGISRSNRKAQCRFKNLKIKELPSTNPNGGDV